MLNDAAGFKRIFIASGYTDLRRGIDGLAGIVQYQFELDPHDKDTIFLFCGRKNDRIKALLWEDDGFLLMYKRVEEGSFKWPRNVTEALEINDLHMKLYGFHVIQADETPVLVNKDGRAAGSKSFMLVYRSGYMYSDMQIVLYEYQRTRNASHPRQFLKDYSGVCVTDGYQVYHTVEKELEDLKIAGCWVHCRRKFDEALKAVPKAAQKESLSYLVIKQIQAVYREEDKLKELKPKDRLRQRQVVIKPLVDALFAYLKSNERKASTAKLEQAVTYALNQEKYLRVFLEDGEVPMDNNASERAIRGFCIGKKNWEMIDTINGATFSAIIYSIAETAKANNLKPYEYFEYLLTQIPAHMDDTDRSFLEDLLPWSPKLPEYIRKQKDRG